MTASNRCLPVAGVILASLVGCSGDSTIGDVRGTVTYKGQPVPFAAVEFHPVGEGKSSLGWTDESGNYTAQYTLSQPGALIGKHTVALRTYAQEGQSPVPVPPEYSGKSGMEFEVKPGSNRFDIKL
jgi:hypothetical protein